MVQNFSDWAERFHHRWALGAPLNKARAERPAILVSSFVNSGYGGLKPSRKDVSVLRSLGSRKLPLHSQLFPGGPELAAHAQAGVVTQGSMPHCTSTGIPAE